MKKFCLFFAGLFLVLPTLSACGGAATSNLAAPMASASVEMREEPGLKAEDSSFYSESMADSVIYTSPDAKVIRSANLVIQTTEFEASVAALAALTEEQGGYYETARVEGGGIYDSNANRSAYYVVRIPKENFTSFRDAVGEVGHLYSIEEGTQDVGERYYDTEARLATLTTKRERLLSLLEKAEKMEDIIALESALADVQYEIDSHTATLRKYDSLIDYATFEIRLNEKIVIAHEPGAADSFGKRLGAAFTDGMGDFFDGVQDLILFLARNLIGVLIVVVVAAVVILKARKRQKLRWKKENRTEE